MKMLMFLVIAILALTAPAAPAHAQGFAVDISDISIVPLTIYTGDTINVTAKFSVSVPTVSISSVKLSLFFDGTLVDSTISTYSAGDYSYTFHYPLDPGKNLNRKMMITAKIYDAGTLMNEDSATRDIYINPRTGKHDLRIVSVTAPQSVNTNADFNVAVSVRNNGDTREDNVQITTIFNGKVYFSPQFSISPGATVDTAIALKAPSSAGRYDIEEQVANAYNAETEKTAIRVSAVFLSLSFSKPSASTGEWVGISGYATKDGLRSAGSVSIYRDDVFIGVVPTTENGYYSTQLKFDIPGTHRVTAIVADTRKDQYIYISGAPLPAPAQQPAPQPIPNYTAVIIVTQDGQKIIYPEAIAPRGKYTGFSFVDAEASTKQLDVIQYAGGHLAITVTNHLGRSGLFSVDTDFNETWVYLPKAEVMEDGESMVFDVFFSPERAGTFGGNIYIIDGQNRIKRLPITLFVVPPPTAAVQEPAVLTSRITQAQAGGLAALFFAAVLVLYLVLRKSKALEPFSIPSIFEGLRKPVAETVKVPQKPAETKPVCRSRSTRPWFFQVPRENIIT